ncbi:MAG: esterase/lipase family protein, partial [Planctomycetota bacterium]
EPTPEKIYSYAELAYVSGQRAQELGHAESAFDYYCHALGHAYRYLFDFEVDPFRNPYDPQFRQVCDLYNGALEAVLRLLKKNGRLRPGVIERIETKRGEVELAIELKGSWQADELEKLEFASDYEVKGLTNQYHTYGLGVPMIGVGKPIARDNPVAKYYPKGLCYAMTAFLRGPRELEPVRHDDDETPRKRRVVLELHDPLTLQELPVAGRLVPLETDLSVALGYHLDHLDIEPQALATLGLISPMATDPLEGIYMLEPYSPHKIPVIMVHGLWSSPMTWMEMFNDLRALPEVRDHYQFWFYLYPTGQPFWVSAAKLRADLAELQRTVAPQPERTSLPHTVLVGHSMGGLVSYMQTIYGGDSMWQLLTDQPFDNLKADEATRQKMRDLIYFETQPMIRRVITIGTPHHGSDYANDYTRWLARKLIRLPGMMVSTGEKLLRDNPSYFHNPELLTTTTSIDSLSSQASIFKFLGEARRAPDVRYHTIIGLTPQSSILPSQPGDGVVSFTSAQLADCESELVVAAGPGPFHPHPPATRQVRPLLLAPHQERERPVRA